MQASGSRRGNKCENMYPNANGPGKLELSRAVPRTDIRLAFFPPYLLPAFRPFGEKRKRFGATMLWRRQSDARAGGRPPARNKDDPESLSGGQPLRVSFRPLAAENFACFDAAMVIFLPLCGLRPSRAARSATLKLPKFGTLTSSPAAKAWAMTVNAASTALPASAFVCPVWSATAATSSARFMVLLDNHWFRI